MLARAGLEKFELIELDVVHAHLIEGVLQQILQVIQRNQHKAVNAVEQVDQPTRVTGKYRTRYVDDSADIGVCTLLDEPKFKL